MDKSPKYMTASPSYYGLLKIFAQENRAYQTDAEERLWYNLMGNPWGLHFRRQHIIGCYIADFVCLKARTIIEVDGGYHSQEKQKIDDYLRTSDLEKMGYHVIRFANERIYNDMSAVLDEIFNQVVKNINNSLPQGG